MKTTKFVRIYIYLPAEAVDVWRPVNAVQISENIYQIVSQNTFDDEQWQFKTGELVRCKERVVSPNEKHLIAYERVLNDQ